jgi:hypothetical protein
VHGLESTWSDRITFIYLDIDDPRTSGFKSTLGYIYQPHLFLLDEDGALLEQWVGYVEGSTLEAAFRDAVP